MKPSLSQSVTQQKNVSFTWSCLKLLPPGLGSAEQDRWWRRVPKTSIVLTVMAIVFCSQFGQYQQFPTIWVVSLFVVRQFEPELKFTEDGQECIWIRTSSQEGWCLQTDCFPLVPPFYHDRVLSCTGRVQWLIWNPDENLSAISTGVITLGGSALCPRAQDSWTFQPNL